MLTISVNPTFITLQGSATVTVIARKPNGQPVNKGSEVFFSTTLGTIDQMATTDEDGVALSTLRGDGRAGEATISATSGAASAAVSDPVKIGSLASSISLQVTPTVVLEEGGTLSLLALVRDDTGVLLPNAVVNFGTDFGILASGGAGLVTDINGEVRDTLTVTTADVAAAGNSFEVRAQTAGRGEGGSTLITATFLVSVARLEPIASFTFSGPPSRTVVFNNESTGAEPLKFLWDFGEGGATSTQRNPTYTYNSGGQKTVTLMVTNEFGSDNAIANFTLN